MNKLFMVTLILPCMKRSRQRSCLMSHCLFSILKKAKKENKKKAGSFNLNCVDPLGRSGVVVAVENENLDMILLLLDEGVLAEARAIPFCLLSMFSFLCFLSSSSYYYFLFPLHFFLHPLLLVYLFPPFPHHSNSRSVI